MLKLGGKTYNSDGDLIFIRYGLIYVKYVQNNMWHMFLCTV